MITDYEAVKARPHYVYRLLGKRGRLLYIGCTVNPQLRIKEWKSTANIGPLLGRVDLLGPYSFAEAREMEADLIRQHEPPFNIEHTSRHRRGYSPYISRGSRS